MLAWLDNIDWLTIIIVGGLLMLAPFTPEPHLFEKLRMLGQGTLSEPVDIFDLLMHASPLLLVIAKLVRLNQVRQQLEDK